MWSFFQYQTFVVVSEIVWWKLPVVDDVFSSNEKEFCFTTSLDKNCIEFKFQMDRVYHGGWRQIFLPSNLKMIKRRGYKSYKPGELQKEHMDESKEYAAENMEGEEMEKDPSVLLVTRVYKTLPSIFSKVKVYINNQQFYKSNGLYAHNSYFSSNFEKPFLAIRESCTAKGKTMKNLSMKFWTLSCPNTSLQGERKYSVHPTASCYLVNWALDFSQLLKCCIQKSKLGSD